MQKESEGQHSAHTSGDPAKSNEFTLRAQHLTTTGPLPPASEIEGYERLLPGSVERILSMAEKEQKQRHSQEQIQSEMNVQITDANRKAADSKIRVRDANIREVKRGQWMAFMLATGYLAATVYLGMLGREVVAAAMGVGGVATVAAVFIKVRNSQ